MSEHTPGQWMTWEPEFKTTNGGDAVTLVIAKERLDMNQEIAYVNCQSSFFNDGTKVSVPSELVNEAFAPAEAVANAHLIAAAPELLATLRRVKKDIGHRMNGGTMGAVREAIAKATGAAIAKEA